MADAANDSNGLRAFLAERKSSAVNPNNPPRKRSHPFDQQACEQGNLVERMASASKLGGVS